MILEKANDLLVETTKFYSLGDLFPDVEQPLIIAGPCSLESTEMLDEVAGQLNQMNVKMLRAGVYKPRTSPYDFQGIGKSGIKTLSEIAKKHNMYSVSEIMDTRDLDYMLDNIDLIQVGTRNMQNFALLKEIGKTNHPVLLKRGMASTIDEFILAAEYIASEGNRKIILCERGIRTFDTATRNTLDIACIPIIHHKTNLPIIVDVSHSLGRKDIMKEVICAVRAVGADGLMIEVHPNPPQAMSDSEQQVTIEELKKII